MLTSSSDSREEQHLLHRIMDEYGDTLLRMCFVYLKDARLAEDAVQDTFIKVLNSHHQFKGESSEKTWVVRIAINVCKNYLRSSWWRRIDVKAVLESIPAPEQEEMDDSILLEIMKLSPKYKEIILLYYYQELKIREIADVLCIPESTVSIRLKRARERLKAKLKGWNYDE